MSALYHVSANLTSIRMSVSDADIGVTEPNLSVVSSMGTEGLDLRWDPYK